MSEPLVPAARSGEALKLYGACIGGWGHLGHRGAVANILENIAFIAADRGEGVRAARMLGAASAMCEAANARMAFDEEPEFAAHQARLAELLAPTELAAATAAGRALTQAQSVAEALAG